jgi:hypothetical protein
MMLIHHLTIVWHKFLFVSSDFKAIWVRKGLKPSDAHKWGLDCVVALTLDVQKLGIYHQKLYLADDEIGLSEFLFDAWNNSKLLQGLPDILCVDQQLLNDYPLEEALKTIDPAGHIKEIKTNEGGHFAASKRLAQTQTYDAVTVAYPPYRNLELKATPKNFPKSKDELLDLLNSRFENKQMYEYEYFTPKPERQNSLIIHKAHNPVRPAEHPCTSKRMFNQEWVRRSAERVPAIGSDQILLGSNDSRKWILFLDVGYEEEQEPVDALDFSFDESSGYRWAKELDWIDSAICALPYSLEEFLPDGLTVERYRAFLSHRQALTVETASELERIVRAHSLVIYPKTKNIMRDSFNYLTHGGDVRCCYELYGGDTYQTPIRIIACDRYDRGLFLIIISKGSQADVPDIKPALNNFYGKLDIGPFGFEALSIWLTEGFKSGQLELIETFVRMVEKMLEPVEEWTNHGFGY